MTHIDDNLWAAVAAHPETQVNPPASAAQLDAFEREHGVPLPPAHRALLGRANGGTLGGLARLFGVGRGDALDLGRHARETRAELERTAGRPVLPFASSWGGDYYCLELAPAPAGRKPRVLFWDHEYSEEPADLPHLWKPFADDLADFLRRTIATRP
jgi:cell wall assembly regulator SMI1